MASLRASSPPAPSAWQVEADLLADGRFALERRCEHWRFRHLYPSGPNYALLLLAYQQLDRERAVGGRRVAWPWWERRRMRRILRTEIRRDALARDARLDHRFPLPRRAALAADPDLIPLLVRAAFASVDADARDLVQAYIQGRNEHPELEADVAAELDEATLARRDRGLTQFRDSLLNGALADPMAIPGLHAQYLELLSSPQPTHKRHPVAALLLVKLPLRVLATIVFMMTVAYLGAYVWFNDEVLGRFVSKAVSKNLAGELEIESIHWTPRLAFDLLTGTPHDAVARGVRIYEQRETATAPRGELTAAADELEVGLVLHEIIPWNRLGIPARLEIPWVLHFTTVRNEGPMWVRAREVQLDGATWSVGLISAFRNLSTQPARPGYRRISFAVDELDLREARVELDFLGKSGWGADIRFASLRGDLEFTGQFPEERKLPTVPFRWFAAGADGEGTIQLLGKALAARDVELENLSMGRTATPLGDLRLQGSAMLGDGAPVGFDGFLRDALSIDPISVSFELGTTNAGPLAAWFLAPTTPAPDGTLERRIVDAEGRPAALSIAGLLSDPSIRIATQGITLDLVNEPAWALDDVAVAVRMERDPVPEAWRAFRPTPAEGDDGGRWIVYFETFRAAGFDGLLRLHGRDQLDHVVLPAEGSTEPLLASMWLDLDEVNPGKLFPSDVAAQSKFAGEADGGVELHELVLANGGSGGLARADVRLHGLVATRDRVAGSDGLPSYVRADGDIVYDMRDGLDLQGLVVATRGGQVSLQGLVDGGWEQVRGGDLALRVDDGAAFLREFGQRAFFETLAAELAFAGPLLAPSGSGGSLSIRGPKSGPFAGTNLDQARLSLDRGTLRIRHDDLQVLGGRGPLELDVVLFEGGRLLADPKVRLSLDLDGIVREDLLGSGIDVEAGGITLRIDDGPGRAAPLSRLQVRGAAKANALAALGARFVNAHASFALDKTGLRIDDLLLERARAPSPHAAPRIEVPTGRIAASGRVGFETDPTLDLDVSAEGIPIASIAALVGSKVPLLGELGQGTRLALGGTVTRPELRGSLDLRALAVAGVPLGGGVLQLATRDVTAGGGLAARREVTLSGDLEERRRRLARDDLTLSWHVEATLAFPLEGNRRGAADSLGIDAEVIVRVASLPLDALLRGPERDAWRDAVEGELRDIVAETRVCGGSRPLLPGCLDGAANDDLLVSLEMASAWARPRARPGERTERAVEASGDPCLQSTALCTSSPLRAELEGTTLRLVEPVRIRSGGRRAASLEVAGSVDLSPPSPVSKSPASCEDGTPRATALSPVEGTGHLDLTGQLDLAALELVLRSIDMERPKGRVDLDLDVDGLAAAPRVRGYLQLAAREGLALDWAAGTDVDGIVQRVPISIQDVAMALDGQRIEATATMRVFDQDLRLTGSDGTPSTFVFAGPCAGRFDVRVAGALDGKLAHALLPDTIVASSGKILVDGLYARGNVFADGPLGARLSEVGGALVLGKSGASLRMRTDFTPASLDGGRIEIVRCTADTDLPACRRERADVDRRPEPGVSGDPSSPGHLALLIGGEFATSPTRPRDAMEATVGERGRAGIWGYVVFPPSLDGITTANVSLALDEVPYLDTDNAGNPQLEIAVSSDRVGLSVDEFGSYAVRGDLVIARSRWLRDAQVGTSVLSFADPYPAPPTALPDFVRELELELDVRTATPFRVDINVVHDLEARAEMTVSGTVANPEVRGTVDVERGEIDIPILGEPYEIERGRIVLDRDAASSFVDLVAIGREPKNVEGQLRYITLEVQGPLDAIRWGCSALGASGGSLDTTRGCVDYLLFDAGNVEMASADVRRAGSGNQLYGRPLTLVGNLTQIRVDDIISRDIPRTKELLPVLEARVGQLGVETKLATRPEWLQWGWGNLGFGVTYLRGYPGGILRDGARVTGRFEILDNTALEAAFGRRNYSQRVLVLDPSRYRAIDFVQTWELPTRR